MKMKNGKTFFTYFYQAEPAGRQVIPISASMRVSAAVQPPGDRRTDDGQMTDR